MAARGGGQHSDRIHASVANGESAGPSVRLVMVMRDAVAVTVVSADAAGAHMEPSPRMTELPPAGENAEDAFGTRLMVQAEEAKK